MNEHIELVEKWLEDNTSVSLEELKANTRAARYEARAADRASDAAAWVAVKAASAAWAAASAAYDAYAAWAAFEASNAADWIKEYEELTGDL